MQRLVTYDSGNITSSGVGTTPLLAIAANANVGFSVQSIYVPESGAASADPNVTFEAHAASAISGGATVSGVKADGTIPGSLATTGKGGSTALTFTDTGLIDAASLPANQGWKVTPGGAYAVAAGGFLVIQATRPATSTGSAVLRAIVQIWELT